jgi:Cdc6-like AAA superfamily ATPase
MAEAFGTGASIVGVIGLAIQITQAAVQLWTDWKDAPENVKAFIAELGTLKTVLSETHANILLNKDFEAAFQNRPSLLLSQFGPNAPSTTDTNRMLDICQKELSSMLKKMGKRVQGSQLGWERFKEAFLTKDTRESVENLHRQCQVLNNMLSVDAVVLGASMYKEVREVRKEQQDWRQADEQISFAIRGGIDESNRRQERQQRKHKRQAILEWLTPIDYATSQNDYIGRRQAKTGQWLLDSAEFLAWVEADKRILFCPGIPGAGKTILTSIVVNELSTRYNDDKSVGIAYLYCNVKRKEDQKLHKLLASLLKQLSQQRSPLPGCVKSLYDKHKDKRTQPSIDEILRVLQSVAVQYSRVFIIVDALDECDTSDGCRHRLLSGLFDLSAKCKANLFITSRPIASIEKEFEGKMKLEISASEEDVQRYLEGNMFRLPGFVVRSLELQEEIKVSIIEAVKGM